MSAHDRWLAEFSEPDAWDESNAPFGLCDFCSSPNKSYEGREYCPSCEPITTEEYIVVKASFEVIGGKVREL